MAIVLRKARLAALQWAGKMRSFAEGTWGNRWFGWFLIWCFGVAYLCLSSPVPSPGKAAVLIAIAAAVMTFRGELGAWERFVWMLVLFSFLFMELKAIDKDRADSAREESVRRQHENEEFNRIASGLEQSLSQSHTQFNTTISKLDENLKMALGGDSFCWISFPLGGGGPALAIPQGHYPLHDVHARVQDDTRTAVNWKAGRLLTAERDLQIGDIPIHSQKPLNGLTFDPDSNRQSFNVYFDAPNGTWFEFIRLRKVNGAWKQAVVVKRSQMTVKGPGFFLQVLEHIDPDYPATPGKFDWSDETEEFLAQKSR
jgi:hypothetical protein